MKIILFKIIFSLSESREEKRNFGEDEQKLTILGE